MLFFKKKKSAKMLAVQNKKPIPAPKSKEYAPRPENIEKPKSVKPEAPSKAKQETVTDYRKEFLKTFKELTIRHRAWDVWRDFVVMTACAISNSSDTTRYEQREDRYLKIIRQYRKREQEMFPELVALMTLALDKNPEQDFLGSVYMELHLGNAVNGQFFTPYSICSMMADLTMQDVRERVEETGYVSLHDSCCGAGAILIAGIHAVKRELETLHPPVNFQQHILVVGQDVDEIAALMCYIQISLLGVPGYVKVGDSLSDPIAMDDDMTKYWFTPISCLKGWPIERRKQ